MRIHMQVTAHLSPFPCFFPQYFLLRFFGYPCCTDLPLDLSPLGLTNSSIGKPSQPRSRWIQPRFFFVCTILLIVLNGYFTANFLGRLY